MKYYCYVGDGSQLYITDSVGGTRVQLEPSAVFPLIDALQEYGCRLREGKECFCIDGRTGEVEFTDHIKCPNCGGLLSFHEG